MTAPPVDLPSLNEIRVQPKVAPPPPPTAEEIHARMKAALDAHYAAEAAANAEDAATSQATVNVVGSSMAPDKPTSAPIHETWTPAPIAPPPPARPLMTPAAAAPYDWGPPAHYRDPRGDEFLQALPSLLALTAIAALCTHIWKRAKINGARPSLEHVLMSLKQRAAAVICVGLGIVALSIFTDLSAEDSWGSSTLWSDIVHNGWLSAFGAILALIGAYHWIGQKDIT